MGRRGDGREEQGRDVRGGRERELWGGDARVGDVREGTVRVGRGECTPPAASLPSLPPLLNLHPSRALRMVRAFLLAWVEGELREGEGRRRHRAKGAIALLTFISYPLASLATITPNSMCVTFGGGWVGMECSHSSCAAETYQ